MRKNPKVQIGVTLPQFSTDVEKAIAVANEAERLGLDGVFVFDHLWPLDGPERPVMDGFELLAALTAETKSVRLGTLVARVGLVPDAVLIHQFETLHRMIGDRLIAGVGSGDRMNAAENLGYGVPFPPAAERLASVEVVCGALRASGIETWVGGRSAAVRRIAAGSADALNVWDASADEVRAERAEVPRITWGGQVGADPGDRLRAIRDAGADFAICSPVDTPWDAALKTLAGAREHLH